jgi:hypothetical protein
LWLVCSALSADFRKRTDPRFGSWRKRRFAAFHWPFTPFVFLQALFYCFVDHFLDVLRGQVFR